MTDRSFRQRLEILELAFLARQPDAMREANFLEQETGRRKDKADKQVAVMAKADAPGIVPWMDLVDELNERLTRIRWLKEQNQNRHLNREMKNSPGQTPEAKLQGRHEGAIRRLWERGQITEHHLTAAIRLASTFEGITRACAMRARVLDGTMGGGTRYRGFDALRVSEWLSEQYGKVYKPWAQACIERGIPTSFVIDVAVYDVALDKARRWQGWGYGKGLKTLRSALEMFMDKLERADIESESSQDRVQM